MGSDDNTDFVAKPKTNIAELFSDARNAGKYLKICAPMVRYSKLEFRHLVRLYGADLCFTPMTMADSFCQSSRARLSEFSTSTSDTPVVAQFAAKNVAEYLSAAEMVHPYVDGIDLNCGCPQSWAISSGYGCAMLRDPQLIKELTQTVRRQLSDAFSVSVKIRIQQPLARTVDLCRQLEHCGVTFISLHGRTPSQKIGEPSDAQAIADVKRSLRVPLIANGDVRTLAGADALHAATGCDGVMSARGILSNPALFGGFDSTPLECVQHWVDLGTAVGDAITFQCFHHHLAFMMERLMDRRVRVQFNDFTRKEQVLAFLAERYGIRPRPLNAAGPQPGRPVEPAFDESAFRARAEQMRTDEREAERQRKRQLYSADASDGKYFRSQADADASDSDASDNIDCSDLFSD